jgi:hypothetical protein
VLDIAGYRDKAPTPPHRPDSEPTEQNEW